MPSKQPRRSVILLEPGEKLPNSVWDVRLTRGITLRQFVVVGTTGLAFGAVGGTLYWLWRTLLQDRSIDPEDSETLGVMGIGYGLFSLLMIATMRKAYRQTLAEFRELKLRATDTHPPKTPADC